MALATATVGRRGPLHIITAAPTEAHVSDLTIHVRRHGHSSGGAWYHFSGGGSWVATKAEATALTLTPDPDFDDLWAGSSIPEANRGDEDGYVISVSDGTLTDLQVVPVVDDVQAAQTATLEAAAASATLLAEIQSRTVTYTAKSGGKPTAGTIENSAGSAAVTWTYDGDGDPATYAAVKAV